MTNAVSSCSSPAVRRCLSNAPRRCNPWPLGQLVNGMPHTHASERLRLYECECKQIIRGRQFRLHRRSTGHCEVSRMDLCLHCMQYVHIGQKQTEFVSQHTQCPLKPPNKEAYFTLYKAKLASVAAGSTLLRPTMCNDAATISQRTQPMVKSEAPSTNPAPQTSCWNPTSLVSTPNSVSDSYLSAQRVNTANKEKDAYLALWKSKMAGVACSEANLQNASPCSLPNCSDVLQSCPSQSLSLTAIPPSVQPTTGHSSMQQHQHLPNPWMCATASGQRPVAPGAAAAWFLPGAQCSIPFIAKAFAPHVKTEVIDEKIACNKS